jgi:diketogulonate reductase-like aldo/keto reductase
MMGYGETWNETAIILKTTGLEYIDHIMMHWPSCTTGGGCGPSTDPLCNYGSATFDEKGCRLSTWRALLDIWKSGLARSVGVSNFNISHLEEIKAANLTLPSKNQVSFHLYHSQPEKQLLEFCQANSILFESWVPLARPDSWTQQPPCAPSPMLDPASEAMAARYNITSAQLQLVFQVQLGMSVIPRSQSAAHMTENLNLFSTVISDADMAALWTFPQSICEPGACTNPVVAGQFPQTCVNNGK